MTETKMKNRNFSENDVLIHNNRMNLKDILNMTMWYSLLGGILAVLGYVLLLFE